MAPECFPNATLSGLSGAGKARLKWDECAWRDVHCALALPYPELVRLGTETRIGRDYRKLLVRAERHLEHARRFDGEQLVDVCVVNASASYIYSLHVFAISHKREEFTSKLRLVQDAMIKMEGMKMEGGAEGIVASGDLESELERRYQLDQLWSGGLISSIIALFGDDESLFTLAYSFAQARGCVVARNNVAYLDSVFDKEGWPSKVRYGKNADRNAWVIAQHADFAPWFQFKALALLRKSVARGDSNPQFVAFLTDRYRVNIGHRQLYGTQYRATCGGNKPFPIADPNSLDARRARLGLGPWAEYNQRIGRPCKDDDGN